MIHPQLLFVIDRSFLSWIGLTVGFLTNCTIRNNLLICINPGVSCYFVSPILNTSVLFEYDYTRRHRCFVNEQFQFRVLAQVLVGTIDIIAEVGPGHQDIEGIGLDHDQDLQKDLDVRLLRVTPAREMLSILD